MVAKGISAGADSSRAMKVSRSSRGRGVVRLLLFLVSCERFVWGQGIACTPCRICLVTDGGALLCSGRETSMSVVWGQGVSEPGSLLSLLLLIP